MNETEAWARERAFWLEGPQFYERGLAPEAIMVLPGSAGVLTRSAVIDAIAHSPRWSEVSFESTRMVHLADTLLLLVYEATAEREGGKVAYRARCSSLYIEQGGRQWLLAFHQQTPL